MRPHPVLAARPLLTTLLTALLLAPLAGCVAPTGPVEVTRFLLAPAELPANAALGRGTVAVVAAPGNDPGSLELRAGKARKDAWAAFADRLGIDDARALATMLRQAEEMGTSLGETLSVFSKDMRDKRMLRAEEKALALSAKLTVPLIMFIFPSLLGALMLPAIARLMHVFAK